MVETRILIICGSILSLALVFGFLLQRFAIDIQFVRKGYNRDNNYGLSSVGVDLLKRSKRFAGPEDKFYCGMKNVHFLIFYNKTDVQHTDERLYFKHFCAYGEWKIPSDGIYFLKVMIGFKAKSQMYVTLEKKDGKNWPETLATCQSLHRDIHCNEEYDFNNCVMTAVTMMTNETSLSLRFDDLGIGCKRAISKNPKYTSMYAIKLKMNKDTK